MSHQPAKNPNLTADSPDGPAAAPSAPSPAGRSAEPRGGAAPGVSSSRTDTTLTLAERIDLDALLASDAKLEEPQRRSQDGSIGRSTHAHQLTDAQAIRAYIAVRLPPHHPSPGRAFVHIRRTLSTILALIGLIVGFTTVATWLATHSGKPVNVIHMWVVVVGVQFLLLIPFVFAWVRLRRLKGTQDAQHPHQQPTLLASALKHTLYKLAERSHAFRDQPEQLKATLAKLRTTYAPLLTRIALRATQSFALTFNIGALVALLVFTTVSDPAFGWRSTLLNQSHVHTIVSVIAAPFAWVPGGAPPSAETIAAVQNYSLEGMPLQSEAPERWAAFFPFLLLSIITYGLIPRLITYGLCVIDERRTLAATPWRTSQADRLLRRLRRPVISTTAEPNDTSDPPTDSANTGTTAHHPNLHPTHGGPITVLRWSGVHIDDAALRQTLTDRLHAQPLTPTQTLGSLDLAADTAAVQHAATVHPTAATAVIVEGWEPPVADHLDLLRTLRRALGPSRIIYVLVAGLNQQAVPTAPTPVQLQTWRTKLNMLGDPYLAIEPLVEPEST